MRRMTRVVAVVGLLFSLSGSVSQAAELGLNVSALLGVDLSSLNASGASASSTSFGWGGRVGYMVHPSVELGASVVTSELNPSYLGKNLADLGLYVTETFITGDLQYHFPGLISPLYVGARAGVGVFSVFNSTTNTSFAFGAVAGCDFPILMGLSVGPRVSFMYATQAASSQANLTDLQAQAALRYAL